jgi:hypothetical protein
MQILRATCHLECLKAASYFRLLDQFSLIKAFLTTRQSTKQLAELERRV